MRWLSGLIALIIIAWLIEIINNNHGGKTNL